ncbi:glutathione S-transferase family protein [Arenicella sp.]|nr:glutathione S-transferase family protein [Arenicella sp.]
MISLYQADMSTCTQKVRFVLEQKGLPWKGISVDLHNEENYSPEFKKINPKAIIPVLNDAGDLVFESNNICLYLDEKYPQTPLMPDTPIARSEVRTLLQLIDEQVHNDSSVCTYAIAFRERIRNAHDTADKLDAYLAAMPDAGRRYVKRQVIEHGTDSAEFIIAVTRLKAMLVMLENRLSKSAYLVGDQVSIADIAYSPYLTRLDHLNMDHIWSEMPAVSNWYQSLQNTVGYDKGLRDFFSDDAIANMGAAGDKFKHKISEILAA